MLTQRMIKVLVKVALLLAMACGSSVVANGLGIAVTPVYACQNSSGGGGGC